MGSSPVTATTVMIPDRVEQALEGFFRRVFAKSDRESPCRTILVAFSGGPDSTALLAGLAGLAPRLAIDLHAAHLDHALDPDSERRAGAALRLAEKLGVPLKVERLAPAALNGRDGPEAAARRARYAFLERVADDLGARFIATAHHADDQAETVLLRLVFGSGIAGLAGIRPQRGRFLRPLLTLPRRQLLDSLRRRRLQAVADPTNDDLAAARNRLRHFLLPRLERQAPGLVERLGGVAAAAAAAAARTEKLLAAHLRPRPIPHEAGIMVSRARFDALPDALLPHALALLHRRAGALYPAAARARCELVRQLATNRGRRAGCDCGDGWRWEAASGVVQLLRRKSTQIEFAYELKVPGEVVIREVGSLFRLRRGPVDLWMFTARPDRAGLAYFRPAAGIGRIEIRNRRPGDRLTPVGRRRRRKLKDLLIERRVPRRQRDRLPLLVIDGQVAWVPGITIDDRYRLSWPAPDETRWAWIAEIEDLSSRGNEEDLSSRGNE